MSGSGRESGPPIEKLKEVADAMVVEMHPGLASENGSRVKMLISYVDNLPTGFNWAARMVVALSIRNSLKFPFLAT